MAERIRHYLKILLAILLVAVVAGAAVPNFVGSRTSSINSIINNLRMIAGATHQWALEKGHTSAVPVVQADLAPYITGGWVKVVAGESYILGTVQREPVAILTRVVEGYPEGTIVTLPQPDGTHIKRP